MKIHKLDIFLQSNFSVPKRISEFYRSVLQSWKDIQYEKVHSIEDIKEFEDIYILTNEGLEEDEEQE